MAAIKAFAEQEGVPLVDFRRDQRKDYIAKAHLARFSGSKGVLFVGRAREKTSVFRTEMCHNKTSDRPYAWIVPWTAIVNQFYIYAVDADFVRSSWIEVLSDHQAHETNGGGRPARICPPLRRPTRPTAALHARHLPSGTGRLSRR